MRILHTSDWHLGRQLHGVSLCEDQSHVLDQIVDIAEKESVDAVIIAGDVYDRAIPPADAVSLLSRTLNRLCLDLGKTVVMISGNHDSGERLGFGADLLGESGLHIVGPLDAKLLPITLENNGITVDIFGLPYAGPLTVRDIFDIEVASHEEAMSVLLTKVNEQKTDDRPTVLVGHCFVDGGEESESERPLSVGGADRISPALFEPYSYVALGHLHRPQFREHEHVRYSGSILKYSFSEVEHQKSVTIVEIVGAGEVTSSTVPLRSLRDLRIVEGTLDEILDAGRTDPKSDDYIMARISDKHAVLDIMGKLRDVYPNVLQMQNIGFRETEENPEASQEMLRKSYMSLFEDFFEEIQEEPLSNEQQSYMANLLETMGEDEQ